MLSPITWTAQDREAWSGDVTNATLEVRPSESETLAYLSLQDGYGSARTVRLTEEELEELAIAANVLAAHLKGRS